MKFHPRNPYYLRISKKDILPVHVYLDDRHLGWMSDIVLQHVSISMTDIWDGCRISSSSIILPKLQAESDANLGPGGPPSSKKATVETHRGDTYQFCYFLRKTQPHSVIVKTRTYNATVKNNHDFPLPPVPVTALKRKSKIGEKEASRKKRKTKGKGRAVEDSDPEDSFSSSEGDGDFELSESEVPPRKATVDRDGDTPMVDGDSIQNDGVVAHKSLKKKGVGHSKTVQFSLQIGEDEEEKPKPLLHLKYQGFKILGSCLCIVVEPWPLIRAPSRLPSVVNSTPRAPSIAPRNFVSAIETRARSKTPLFLPDPDERDRNETPFPNAIPVRPMQEPLHDRDDWNADGEIQDFDIGGMIEFSQVLNAVGDVRAGALDDEGDLEGEVLFGDADEVREL
ncbi:hypothetical protein D9757_002698 [Collybiopsis confluens]|uniref:Uncharacterized protein n=1 Tax=Collybiopsis confluens TaxID=2823264 RepID=A0A8H5HW08_9AGAR|nr:hypothetical protein D9757_002698 [Collybiopsis confluens]